jgi:hypothetical protein
LKHVKVWIKIDYLEDVLMFSLFLFTNLVKHISSLNTNMLEDTIEKNVQEFT